MGWHVTLTGQGEWQLSHLSLKETAFWADDLPEVGRQIGQLLQRTIAPHLRVIPYDNTVFSATFSLARVDPTTLTPPQRSMWDDRDVVFESEETRWTLPMADLTTNNEVQLDL